MGTASYFGMEGITKMQPADLYSRHRQTSRVLSGSQIPSMDPKSVSRNASSATANSPKSPVDPRPFNLISANTTLIKADPVALLVGSSNLRVNASSESPDGGSEVIAKANLTLPAGSSKMQVDALVSTNSPSQLLESWKRQVDQVPRSPINELPIKGNPGTSPYDSSRKMVDDFSEPAVGDLPLDEEPSTSPANSLSMRADWTSQPSGDETPVKKDASTSLPGPSKVRLGVDPEALDDPPIGQRNLRKRKKPEVTIDPVEEAMKPLTDEERRNWKGWVELESDPALFNYILRQYGVKDVKILEAIGLDDDSLSFLPKPVYGLVFLFKYRDDDAEEHEAAQKCPKHVWFANQTTNNACATVALLNIVMNVPDLDLGENLQTFKESTSNLKPPYRGKRLGEDQFIRNIHNSFARKMDILNADLALKNEYDKWIKAKKNQAKKNVKKKATPKKRKEDEDEPGYHFIAYVPVQGEVWRLDGLQRDPVNLGPAGQNWVGVARDNICQRVMQYEDDGVEYSLMSLCKSPMKVAIEELASNASLIHTVDSHLSEKGPGWKEFVGNETFASLEELYNTCGLSKDLIDASTISESEKSKIDAAKGDSNKLCSLYRDLVKEQRRIRSAYMQEVTLIGQEDEQALMRKKDYTPVLYKAMRALAEAGVLKGIIMDLREKEKQDKQG